ncbi:hypothetical protein SD412_20235 [Bacteroides fragilis]|nr:hypothetical protein [Bacteroides fragilis]MBE6277896.1 hypothetical protein [Bacteroides sp.]MCS2528157.1 hypothetical protein [Bacteroides fragilis]
MDLVDFITNFVIELIYSIMKVIALEGDSNSGKTQTLNLVYTLLIQAGYTQVSGAFQDLSNNDCSDVFRGFGKTVGIVTQGDYAIGTCSVKNHLAHLQSFGCDVAVCACTIGTSKQKIKDAIMAYPSHYFEPKLKSSSVSLERIDNFHCANKIMGMI